LIEQILVLGAITGAMYALLALGFTLIYGVAEVVNMAYGAISLLGTYMFIFFASFWAITQAGITVVPHSYIVLAIVLAAIVVGILGSIIYRFIIDPVVEDLLALLVVTIGVAIILQQSMAIGFGHYHRAVSIHISGSIALLGVRVITSQVIGAVVSLVLFAILWIFIAKTKTGGAMRATASDREAAMLMGIDTRKLSMLTMAISSSLAAVAGILTVASTTQIATPYIWTEPLIMSFAIVILGGLGSIKGSFIASFIFGYSEQVFITFMPGYTAYLRGAFALAVMVAVLVLRPRGLFGKHVELED